jgi:hypothetical protein
MSGRKGICNFGHCGADFVWRILCLRERHPESFAIRQPALPEIIELIQEQRYLDLLQNAKLIEAMNDPTLAMQVKNFDFQKALDYAQKK